MNEPAVPHSSKRSGWRRPLAAHNKCPSTSCTASLRASLRPNLRAATNTVCSPVAAPADSRGSTRTRTCIPHAAASSWRSEEHTSELQSQFQLVCRLLLEKKKKKNKNHTQ